VNRRAFLARVRAALGRAPGDPVALPPPVPDTTLVAPAPIAADALADRFDERARAAGVHVHHARDAAEAEALVARLAPTRGASGVADASAAARAAAAASGLPHAAPTEADVGVTSAWAGVAETGTIVLHSRDGRAAGLLPPVHVALLATSELFAGLTELYAAAEEAGLPAALVQVTGPSRTADIEVTLVTGVHGPGAVHVVRFG
jgi:L-lactate dehydrogenase complex protein LldG